MQRNLRPEQSHRKSSGRDRGHAASTDRQSAIEQDNARLYQNLKDSYNYLKITQSYLDRAGKVPEQGKALRENIHLLNNSLVKVVGLLDLIKGRTKDAALQRDLSTVMDRADEVIALAHSVGKIAREISESFKGLPELPSSDALNQLAKQLNTEDGAAGLKENKKGL
jgi:hypothetical protein